MYIPPETRRQENRQKTDRQTNRHISRCIEKYQMSNALPVTPDYSTEVCVCVWVCVCVCEQWGQCPDAGESDRSGMKTGDRNLIVPLYPIVYRPCHVLQEETTISLSSQQVVFISFSIRILRRRKKPFFSVRVCGWSETQTQSPRAESFYRIGETGCTSVKKFQSSYFHQLRSPLR